MRWLVAISIATVAAAVSHSAEPNPPRRGLAVHEWGVFRVNPDGDFANAELRAEWDGLPAFIYGYIKGRVVPHHWGIVETRFRPLVFFHASRPQIVKVKVDFPGGVPGVWYPATEHPSIEGNFKQPRIGTSLEWLVGIKKLPELWLTRTPTPPEVADTHWFAKARKVKCDEIFAKYGPRENNVEREKFIFYDGLFPASKRLKIAIDGNEVTLTSQVAHPVFDVTVVDRRREKPRIARIDRLDAKAAVARVKWIKGDAATFVTNATQELTEQLVAAGLFEDEAKLLVDSWKTDMFERPGLHVFYRIPQSEYDTRMPLTITPEPDSTVRVGLVFHGHLEPDFADRILGLVKELDSKRFADRESASRKLLEIGPAALVQIQRLRDRKDLSEEVRGRIDVLIKKWDAKAAFDQ